MKYDTDKKLNQKDLEEAIISMSTKNSMEDDSPVFSLVLLGKEQWDAVLGSNDLVRIRVIPDSTKGKPKNPYIMVGLISEVFKEGEYDDGMLFYRVTGRAMSKALIDFEVGVIQEVSTVITDFGWLPDKEEGGLNFSGNSAAGIGEELMDRFVYKHTKYKFSNGKKLKDYFAHEFDSWDVEALTDVTPFINYEGSMRQFLEDVTAKPFNELYFEYTRDGKCVAIMRPTPFDPGKWRNIPRYSLHSDAVVEESFGKSDAEMHSVFVVHAPNLPEFSSVDLGVFPQYHKNLLDKYGYKRLDAENRYLMTSGLSEALEDAEDARPEGDGNDETGDPSGEAPPYDAFMDVVNEENLTDKESLRKNRNAVEAVILEAFPMFSNKQVKKLVDMLETGDLNRSSYTDVTLETGDDNLDKNVNKEKNASSENLERFTKKLFNWYSGNANFYAGDIRVVGNPKYRVGSRLLYKDKERNIDWEFYLESVQHEFSLSSGYTTILGVTRGLPYGGKDRFKNLWGKSKDFKGGYFGEMSLEQLKERAEAEQNANAEGGQGSVGGAVGDLGGAGGNIAMATLSTAREMTSKKSRYVLGGGRKQSNPLNDSTIVVDCSSFVWWCYYVHGVSLNGGKTGMTTDTIKVDSKFTTVSPINSSKKEAMNKLTQGDIVYFDTYKVDGHLGIYAGNGKFVGAQTSTGIAQADMTSGYWWDKFNGRVLRYPG